jgi:hypothetical protein
VEWLQNTPEYQKYMAAFDEFYELITPDIKARNTRVDGCYPTGYYYKDSFSIRPSARNILAETPNWRIFENDEELVKLEREQNALLVKLTYEKDMDRIQELLSAYGIEI